MNPRLRTALLLLFLFVATWVPRVVALDQFVTIDERKWLARSANFYYALAHGDLAATFQREHPGVTVMWAGTLGFLQRFPAYAQQAPGYFDWNQQWIERWLLENTAVTPLELLTAGRWWIVLAASLLVTLTFFPLRRLLGARLAVLAILFVAWMPFAVALSRQLHPDSTVSSLIFAALAFFLAWLYTGYRWRDLIVSGIMMGLAWLTKTPAAFLVPTGALLIGLELWRGHREATQGRTNSATDDEHTAHPAGWRSLLVGYAIWGAVASATFFLLWPAMWVDPLGTFARMAAEMEEYVGGHINPNYFWGRTTDDPGPLFYPVAYFFRSTPATLVGLIAALFLGWQRRAPFDRPLVRRTAWAFALFALVFVGLMTIPAKKFDRYILPAFLALDVVAVLGWVGLAHRALILFAAGRGRLADAHSRLHRRGAAAIVLAALLLTHALFTLTNYPYYLTYFNPLFGGSMSAPKVLLVGWGEGLDQVGRWLNQQPDGANKRVVSWYHDGPLSYYFDGEANGISYDSPLAWLDTDYVVLYINQVQRAIPSVDSVDFFLSQPSAFVADIDGLELAYVYDMNTTPLPPFTGLNTSAAAAFDDQLRLIAHDLSENEAAPGDTVLLTLHLQSIAPMSINYNILVRLVGPDGTELWREEGWPWGAPTRDWPVREVRSDGHEFRVPLGTDPGIYKLTMSLYDPDTLDPLSILNTTTGDLADESTHDIALLRVGATPEAASLFPVPWQFGNTFALSGATLPETVTLGSDLPLTLQWESLAETATDYTVFVHVVDSEGGLIAQQDRPPMGGFAPTHTWSPGLQIDDTLAIPLPADLTPGPYEVRAGLYVGDSRLPVSQDGTPRGDYAIVGVVEVQ